MTLSVDQNLKSQLQQLAEHATTAAVVTDIDGTICPIVPRPDDARVAPPTLALLANLSERFHTVALISGRSADDMFGMVPLPRLVMAGNHGMEWRDDGGTSDAPEAAAYRPIIERLARELGDVAGDGVIVQPKGLSVSLHYRLAPDPAATHARLVELLRPFVIEHGLRLQEGRRVVDLRPDIPVDKGYALGRLARRPGLTHMVFMGDDQTDIAAFRRLEALRREGTLAGFSVAVSGGEEAPGEVAAAADYAVSGPTDAVGLLEVLLAAANSSASLS